jgi:hypothetical protein
MQIRFIVGLLLLFLVGCDDGGQSQFIIEMNQVPQGITRTDRTGTLIKNAEGNVVEEDLTDWRVSPYHVGHIRFNPLYPNPASEGFVTLSFVITASNTFLNGIIVRGYNDLGQFVLLDQVDRTGYAGAYAFNFDVAKLSASGTPSTAKGIHRLFIIDRLTNEPISYGDIMIQ